MLRLIAMVVAVILFSPPFNSARGDFAKYNAIEAYEIRPGILMMPTYSADGQVCEIGFEVRHYSPELIRLDSDLSQSEKFDQILEEVVPDSERGPKAKDPLGTLITRSGSSSITTNVDYERVSVQIYGHIMSQPRKKEILTENVAAVIHWKGRECQK
ncbi:MAG: hypothetical protein WAM91_05130 [Candidatus Acidiferrales bacterium]